MPYPTEKKRVAGLARTSLQPPFFVLGNLHRPAAGSCPTRAERRFTWHGTKGSIQVVSSQSCSEDPHKDDEHLRPFQS